MTLLELQRDTILRNTLKQVEGYRAFPYDDATGKPVQAKGKVTIFWGLNLTDLDPAHAMELAEFALTQQINAKAKGIRIIIPRFEFFSDDEQRALVNLAYNIGLGGLAGFKKMITALIKRDRLTASKEVLDCNAYRTAKQKNLGGLIARYEHISSLIQGPNP